MYELLFLGDTFLRTNKLKKDESPFSPSVKKLFQDTQNICVNLETAVGSGGIKTEKAYNFQVSSDSLDYLKDNHIEICSLANNHSLDFGEVGLQQTISNLNNRHLSFIGTEEFNLKKLNIGNKTISISSYYGNSRGLARLKQDEIIKNIKKHKQSFDYIFICLHWGEEYVAYPSPRQQKIAHALIDAGADVIIGHHPHVMQGIEKYKQGLIFYSLGNFNFFVDHPYAKKLVETTKAYCVGLDINEEGDIKHEIIPICINEKWQPEVISDEKEKKRFFQYFNAISMPLRKGIGRLFYLIEASPHFFHNHLPSWKKRIKNCGNSQLLQMVKWLIHPATYKYYIGLVLSLFHKSVRY